MQNPLADLYRKYQYGFQHDFILSQGAGLSVHRMSIAPKF